MIMAGLEFTGKIPFHTVYIHGTVRDETGTKMSKSLGNIIDPLEIIDEYGADALRFSIIAITSQGQDVFLARHRFETGRNFTNKIWNAYRFVRGCTSHTDEWNSDDWFIMGKLQTTIRDVTKNLSRYRFKEAAQLIYDFFWHDFCDKYIEAVKGLDKQAILCYVLETTLKLLHPFMPFITEEIWQRLGNKGSIMISQWPEFNKKYYKKDVVTQAEEKFELISKGRSLRSEYNIEPAKRLDFYIKPHKEGLDSTSIARLLGAENLIIDKRFKPGSPMPSGVTGAGTIYMSLKGVDLEKERARLEKELQEIEKELDFVNKKLKNKQFCAKAPKEIIEKERDKKKEFLEKRKKIMALVEFL
jgi:valyl-tRNA synthetase